MGIISRKILHGILVVIFLLLSFSFCWQQLISKVPHYENFLVHVNYETFSGLLEKPGDFALGNSWRLQSSSHRGFLRLLLIGSYIIASSSEFHTYLRLKEV